MKRWAYTLWLSGFFCSAGAGDTKGEGDTKDHTGGGVSSPPPSSGPNVAGNWQFSTTSTAGMPPATIAGGINQSGSSVSGAVHVGGSKCFDRSDHHRPDRHPERQ